MQQQFSQLNQWFELSLGRAVAKDIKRQNLLLLGDRYYSDVLHLGIPAIGQWMSDCSIGRLWTASTCLESKQTDWFSHCHQLPLEDHSIDLLVVPFILEMYQDIDSLVQELDRVLRPEGRLLLWGINPISLWCLFNKQHQLNPPIHLRTLFKVRKYWLDLAYQIDEIGSIFYRPPFKRNQSLERFVFLESIGKMLWPYPGGIYYLLATKVQSEFIAIKPLWSFKKYVLGKHSAQTAPWIVKG